MTASVPSRLHPRLRRTRNALVSGWNQIGSQTRFYATTLAGIPDAVINYRSELLRVIAQMGLGSGALAVIGGTVVIVAFLTMTTGAIVAVQGYNQLASVGVEALTGFASAFFNTREIQPGTVMVALAATVGAGSTAQLGAMRISEEIDALEAIGIRTVSYLASTRVLAGVIVAVPLFCIGLMTAYWAARIGTTAIYGQGSGVYDHYFYTYLSPTDVLWSLAEVAAVALMIMLLCTYYGYTARGGPAGVGEAVGRAVRASMVIASILIVIMTLAIYGQSGDFHLAG
ncbi:ABC transporter permease [Mycobacterium neglectum]|uniref:ABC transporter permease n=1 Tax=Mycobacterium neglectum TaxID=242737 RepID=UPI000BFED60F|nr:ABC transporter permease [Mycobacterium neglectum]